MRLDNSKTEKTPAHDVRSSGSLEQIKAKLLFPGMAFAIGVIAFAVGYRIPKSLPATAARAEDTRATQVSGQGPKAFIKSGANDRSRVRVEGFAQIGFVETEELLTTSSPKQREQWAQELFALGDKPLQRIALIGFYSAWLDLDPEEALRSLQNYPDILHRGDLLTSVSAACPPALQPKLLAIVSTWSEMEQRFFFPGLLVHLAETDPMATAKFIDSHPTQVSDSDAAALISAWALDDASSAARWLKASSYSSNAKVVRSLVESWLSKDPVAAQDYVVAHRQTDGVEGAAGAVALYLFKSSPEQTREFIRLFDDERASTLLASLAESATEDQLAGLMNWLGTFPASIENFSLENAFSRYYAANSAQALKWLRSQPAAERDTLLAAAIMSHADATPDLFSLANQISDGPKRDHTLALLVQVLTGDAGDGREQIRGLDLPAPQTKHLLELYAALTNDAEASNNH